MSDDYQRMIEYSDILQAENQQLREQLAALRNAADEFLRATREWLVSADFPLIVAGEKSRDRLLAAERALTEALNKREEDSDGK